MKGSKSIFLMFVLLSVTFAWAQAPQKMSYQSVVRNSAGNLVANAQIGLKVTILQGSISGTPVYSETHNGNTNSNGLATLEIGAGNVQLGNFGVIDWSAGPYFINVEIDPNGGTSYTISSVSQFLSVPYALYAENTKSGGRNSVYITGLITNAQAAAQIAAEVGPNTENIYIFGTSALTDLTIAGAEKLVNLKISANTALQSVTINDVKVIYDTVLVTDNPNLNTLVWPDIEKMYGSLFRVHAPALYSVSMPALTELINFGMDFQFVSAFVLPSLQVMGGGGFFYVSTFDCPALQTIHNTINISGGNVNLPALQHADNLKLIGTTQLSISNLTTGSLDVTNSLVTSLTLPNFASGTLKLTNWPQLTSISIPNFTSGNLNIQNNSQLTSLTFPSLTTFGPNTIIRSNVALTSLSFPALTHIDNSVVAFPNLQLQSNALTSSNVNSILNKLLTVGTVYGVNLTQVPAAPPTGQGIIDKQTLIAQGKNIITN